MKKLTVLLSVLILLLSACGSPEQPSVPETTTQVISETTVQTEPPAADGFDILGGSWKVGAVYSDSRIIDITDIPALADLYDTVYLKFNQDGTFTHADLWIFDGEYTRSKTQQNSFILTRKTKSNFKDGALTTEPYDGNLRHIVTILDNDTIRLGEYDPITGSAKPSPEPLIFVRKNQDSNFVNENKTVISEPSSNPASTEAPSANVSYEKILNSYSKKMKDALPRLISAYRTESRGTADIERMALICNSKVEELAKICNEGVEQMAKLMQSNGDTYRVYEEWAGKLMDAYMDYAMEIQNAYLDSVVN